MALSLALGTGVASVLTLAGPSALAAVQRPGAAAPSCTTTWTGSRFGNRLWGDPSNWSTGTVPGPASDVCFPAFAYVITSDSIAAHALHLAPWAVLATTPTPTGQVTVTIGTALDMTAHAILNLRNTTIKAAKIIDPGGTIETQGTDSLDSPDVVVSGGAQVSEDSGGFGPGKLTVAGMPQLAGGTLAGASFTSEGVTVLPGDITRLVSASISTAGNQAFVDLAGKNALAGLTSIDAKSSLQAGGDLSLTGGLTASGGVQVNGAALTLGGSYTQAQGALTLDGPATLGASQVTIAPSATLSTAQGAAVLTGNLVNNGSVQVAGSPVHVAGSYTQAPAASLGISFGSSLAVAGRATLAGSTTTSEGFPSRGATSTLVSFGSRSGSFASHGLGFSLVTKAHEIDAVIEPQIAAPATAAAGAAVTVTGASFAFGSTVKIFLDNTGGTPLATTGARVGGRFAASATIPSSAKAGRHTLIAVGSGGDQAHTTITVG